MARIPVKWMLVYATVTIATLTTVVLLWLMDWPRSAREDTAPPRPLPDATGGGVSQARYTDAISQYLSCLRDAGYETVGPVLSPFDGRTLFRDAVPSGEVDEFNATLDRCDRESDMGTIEPGYLRSTPPDMADELIMPAVGCLGRQDVVAEPDELGSDYSEVIARVPDKNSFNACMIEAARSAFPELPENITIFY